MPFLIFIFSRAISLHLNLIVVNRLFFLIVLFFVSCAPTDSVDSAKGSLFIIGGGERSAELILSMTEQVTFESGDYVIILPMASEEPDESYELIKSQIHQHVDVPVIQFNFSKETGDSDRF